MENIEIISTKKLLDYKDFRYASNLFIETGSAAGDGIQRALHAGFSPVISIEAQLEWFEKCEDRFSNYKGVELFQGKSIDRLKDVIRLNKESNAVIFLDAHVSGEASFGYQDWLEKGEDSDAAQDKTIKAELNIILNNTQHINNIIIIDDVNGLADGHAVEYCEIMLKINPNYKFYFYDENLSKDPNYYYNDKILVAIP